MGMNKASTSAQVKEFYQLSLEEDKELLEALQLSTQIFRSPVAALSLVDNGGLRTKLSIGTSNTVLQGLNAYLYDTTSHREIIIIEDTDSNERYYDQLNSHDGNKPRFFAAAPLTTKHGLYIGALCLIDYVPHPGANQERNSLMLLTKHVVTILESKLDRSKLDRSFSELERAREIAIRNEIKLRALFESLTDVYVFLSMSGEILEFNQAAYDYISTFKGKKMVRGGYTADYLNEVDNAAFMASFYTALGGERVNQEMLSYGEVDERVWWDSIFEPVRDKNGEMMGVSYIARNINKRKMDSEKILKQNKILKNIAQIHAHEYRGPVCAILGIMDLIEGDGYQASKEYLLMLQRAVKKLDDKTHTVINLISDLDMVSDKEKK